MGSAPRTALAHRHAQIRRLLAQRTLGALVVTSLPNVLYLTNFTGSSAIVVITADRLLFITDSRYVTVVTDAQTTSSACPDLELVKVESSYDVALVDVLREMGEQRVGFEADHLPVSRHQWLAATLAGEGVTSELVPVEGLVEQARIVKDAHELAALTEAGRRLSKVASTILHEVRAGREERDVALAIDWAIRKAGFERSAFETIVAGGPNSALPHAHPGDRRFVEGDLVVLDFGGVYDSYCVDLTRTVSVGAASPRARKIHAAVLNARNNAIAAVKAGVSRFAVDSAARDTLAAAGMAAAFGHGTGHGLGIEVHEAPRIAPRRPGTDNTDDPLAVNTVFTIEPGAYFPGFGGVRIEDDVVVAEEGARLLTDVTTDLLEL
ncbi:MAG: M24 family metallopeptidase [Vicinamibacterales bacterium]